MIVMHLFRRKQKRETDSNNTVSWSLGVPNAIKINQVGR